jgi:hypothetical protein
MADTAIVQRKTFFQKPESITTVLSFVILGLIGFYFLDQILPMVDRVLEYALSALWHAVLLGGSILILTVLITSQQWHTVIGQSYLLLMRWITSWVVELDPIGIMKGYLKSLKENRTGMADALGSLRGQEDQLGKKIKAMTKEIGHRQDLAVEAHNTNKKMQFALQSRKAGRLEDSNLTLQGLHNRVKAHIAVMEKMLEASDFMIEDIADTIEVKTEERKMIRATHKAVSAAKRILQANEQREMYDLAIESIANDYSKKIGEIEQFMFDSKNFIETMDLENGAYEADALAKIEEWGQRSTKLLTGGTGKTTYALKPANVPDFAAQDRQIEASIDRGSFANLYDKLDK